MKIKVSFVTNSSSTTYIIIDTNEIPLNIEQELIEWHNEVDGGRFDHFEISEIASFTPNQIKEFKTFNNYDKELDWVEECTGAKYNKVGSRKIYGNVLNILSKGKTIHYLVVNNNMNLSDFIECSNNLESAYCSEDWYNDDWCKEWLDE